ncbi:hypothetical protein IIZ72_01010 [Candidatus Saccharibacteria bacterium]|jgi:hypothetical protein|nr:hypothetical protein [Candidatus Saccharibacteria bacterium]
MEITPEITDQLTEALIAALPESAEDDYQAWLKNPSEEGFLDLLAKYNIDAAKIARATVLKEKENEQ